MNMKIFLSAAMVKAQSMEYKMLVNSINFYKSLEESFTTSVSPRS